MTHEITPTARRRPMHPFNLPDQTVQIAADRSRQLRTEAKNWRQARRAARTTRVTRPSAA
jgi:hypothetical protein